MLAAAASASAQGQSCDLGRSRQLYIVAQGAVTYVGGPVFQCNNGTTITADSAVYVQSTGRVDFIRNVRFNEAKRSLTSEYAQYVGRERRLMAQQNVVLIDKEDGTTLRAIALDYLQEGPNNPQARIDVYSGRPRAVMVRKNDSTAVVDTTIIDADRMQILGEDVFKGWGAVDVTRGTLKTRSSYAEFDQNSYMRLYGAARVESDSMTLVGDSIDAEMADGESFKSITARRNGRVDSRTSNVVAPRITITFDKGEVSRLVAVGGKRAYDNAPQAVSTSDDFTLVADSIDAKSPQQRIDQIIAVGAARGEKAPDSLDADLPSVIAQDWVRGDTVQAYFARDTTTGAANADTTQVLERLVAKGSPAASTYRLREQVNDTTEISVNYLTAKMIDVVFKEGEVEQVRAEGDIRGIYLQPPTRTAANEVPTRTR